ncbi:SDR family oxidoreductase [Jeotgalibaca caeni]|uniref:SDR family oxidoreductase n=1 Tax=Jeotgalibaca caeni TaxID=3028623 RepID=UPI00237DFE35|nr:SDR family oxidoreductase [Jeotgalibaca caeni]MDE1548344.1 SDR family oxidoreductase [Jeotgalibaca caeni]
MEQQRKVSRTAPTNFKDITLKKVNYQTMVLTGATSGIGLVTARMAAAKGTKLVLVARNEEALKQLTEEITAKGTQAVYVKADVSKEEDIQKIVETAIRTFGGFDTWVNNASVTIYGHITDIPVEDMRQLFEINYWGVVYGSLAAVHHFKEKGSPGALINVGSVIGNRGTPIQSVYSSSKFAVHSFTDGLRMELEKEQVPISVSQIHPAKINTPYTDHATSYIDHHPSHQAMMYPPESVAEAILFAAEKPVRDMYVGTHSKVMALLGTLAPRFTDRYMEKLFYPELYDPHRVAKEPSAGNLYESKTDLSERGSNIGWERKTSWMVKAKKYPTLTKAAVLGVGLAALAYYAYQNDEWELEKKMKHAKKKLKKKELMKLKDLEMNRLKNLDIGQAKAIEMAKVKKMLH